MVRRAVETPWATDSSPFSVEEWPISEESKAWRERNWLLA